MTLLRSASLAPLQGVTSPSKVVSRCSPASDAQHISAPWHCQSTSSYCWESLCLMVDGGRVVGPVAEPGSGDSWLRKHACVVSVVSSTSHIALDWRGIKPDCGNLGGCWFEMAVVGLKPTEMMLLSCAVDSSHPNPSFLLPSTCGL